MSEFPLIEKIWQFQMRDHPKQYRAWLEDDPTDDTHLESVIYHNRKRYEEMSCKEVAMELARYPGINAVEVKNQNGNGIVVYTKWP